MTQSLDALIERLEKLDAGDRNVDGDLWWYVSLNDEMRKHYDPTGYVRKVIEREGSAGKGLSSFYDSSRTPPSMLDHAPKYTASLDAALALVARVLPGREWWIGTAESGGFVAELNVSGCPGAGPLVEHKTPALALCLATLQALRKEKR